MARKFAAGNYRKKTNILNFRVSEERTMGVRVIERTTRVPVWAHKVGVRDT